jgi:hypothetical protein
VSDGARLIAVIPDREFHQTRDDVAALSSRLVELQSPLVSANSEDEQVLTIVDPTAEYDPSYLRQIAPEHSQVLNVSVYGRYWGPWPGYRLLAEWLKHHLACEVYLGSSYGRPWVTFDASTVAEMNQSYVRMFCEDTQGASHLGLPWPAKVAEGHDRAVVAARFGLNRFEPALESLADVLSHHRKYRGQVPIPGDGPAMMIFDVPSEPRPAASWALWRPVYRPDDPTFAIPHAHRFAVISTSLPLSGAGHMDAWPLTRFLFEVLMGIGGEPVYGATSEADNAARPQLLSQEDMAKLTRAYLSSHEPHGAQPDELTPKP